MTYTEIMKETPGFILDMYTERVEYDARMSYGKSVMKALRG